MDFEDLKKLYLKRRGQLGTDAYKHISELLKEAKKLHRQDWLKHPTPVKTMSKVGELLRGKILKN
jgi:type II restriction enzyme